MPNNILISKPWLTFITLFYLHLLYGLKFWGHARATELDRMLVSNFAALECFSNIVFFYTSLIIIPKILLKI